MKSFWELGFTLVTFLYLIYLKVNDEQVKVYFVYQLSMILHCNRQFVSPNQVSSAHETDVQIQAINFVVSLICYLNFNNGFWPKACYVICMDLYHLGDGALPMWHNTESQEREKTNLNISRLPAFEGCVSFPCQEGSKVGRRWLALKTINSLTRLDVHIHVNLHQVAVQIYGPEKSLRTSHLMGYFNLLKLKIVFFFFHFLPRMGSWTG